MSFTSVINSIIFGFETLSLALTIWRIPVLSKRIERMSKPKHPPIKATGKEIICMRSVKTIANVPSDMKRERIPHEKRKLVKRLVVNALTLFSSPAIKINAGKLFPCNFFPTLYIVRAIQPLKLAQNVF